MLLLVGVALADQALGRCVFTVLIILGMTLQAQREFLSMSGCGSKGPFLLTALATITLFSLQWFHDAGTLSGDVHHIMLLVVIAHMMAALSMATALLQKSGRPDASLVVAAMAGTFSLCYVALPMGFLAHMAMTQGVAFAALMVLVSKCGDMGGYLVGSRIGRHRVMPHVSPRKSWEGSVGGLMLTLVVLWLGWRRGVGTLGDFSLPWLALFGFVMNLATQAGDFAESMIKRCFKVKDSANLLPTFGGALDILDSLVFAMPVAAWFTSL